MERALNHLRILDLTMNLPGPYMTWVLAGLGAEVVKVEPPRGGDYARGIGGQTDSLNPMFVAVNRDKKSLALNLKSPEGRELFLGLLGRYDIVVEGFRPGVMAGLGLDYEDLKARRPDVIMVSISGYGQDGPKRDVAGHDINYLALAGVLHMTGARGGPPAVPGVQVADLAGGSLPALVALLAAVIQREHGGGGQHLDISMFDGAFSLAAMVFAMADAGLDTPGPAAMLLNGRLPCYGVYRTRDGRHMSLGALEPKFWVNFCHALGREDLLDGQFGPDAVREEVAGIFADRTQEEWVGFMAGVDACCEPVRTLGEAADSDLVQARRLTNRAPDGGRYLDMGFRLPASPRPAWGPAPGLGEHTDAVLAESGLDAETLGDLRRRGVIA